MLPASPRAVVTLLDLNDEGRPPAKERPHNVTAGDIHESSACVRCERCSAPLTAAKSVERGLGPVCWAVAS
jgi:hypothetical protein